MSSATPRHRLDEEPALPRLLTADEIADLLRTTKKAIYAMVERGQIPGVVRFGRRLLFDRAAVVAWVHRSRAPSHPEWETR